MARTTRKKAGSNVALRVTRDLAPATNGKAPRGGATNATLSGGLLVVMGDGSVRSGDGSVVPADGSVRSLKPTP